MNDRQSMSPLSQQMLTLSRALEDYRDAMVYISLALKDHVTEFPPEQCGAMSDLVESLLSKTIASSKLTDS
ncbi:hypothetical protein [Rhodoferax sp. GW822-FHT02A01]|uniref:hypothetical protein n=1 Tax=Rhodoferax sp. GW822-FHT02A01 TaxID=3141537 RepID=UPI00315CAE47